MGTTRDPVGLALASLGAGSATGAAVVTAGMLVFSTRLADRSPGEFRDEGFLIISLALLLGIVAAVATGWTLTKRLDDPWRRGVTGAVSVFGTALLSVVTMPIHTVAGVAGLVAYLAVLLLASIVTHRAAHRSANR
ncbi:MAG: hypothetical protein JSW51_10595 [Gemmatimonadota bacterium]|nr:MAG: hypothetical protein JSW51_10595 [Gemmatimonadota bacterium]